MWEKLNKVRVDILELTPAPIRSIPSACLATYSCHLIISQTADSVADVTRLSIHLGTLYFHQRLFFRGIGAQRPNGVSVSVVDRCGLSHRLMHPHCHDTAQNNRLAALPAEAVRPVLHVYVFVLAQILVPVWVDENVCGGGGDHLMCAVMSAMQHSCFFFFLRSRYCLYCVSRRLPRLFVR